MLTSTSRTPWTLAAVIATAALAMAPAVLAQDAATGSAVAEETEPVAPAPPPPLPKTLDELLDLVRDGFQSERMENVEREREFQRRKNDQQRLLDEALAVLAREEATSQQLEQRYNNNEPAIAEAEARLAERLGQLGELFGVVRQVATDLSGQIWDSLTTSQLGGRKGLLDRLGRSKELPSTEDLEKLWYELQHEMTEQGKVVRYTSPVLTLQGQTEERQVVRAGPFSVISNGAYLVWSTPDQQLQELDRQPPSKYLSTVAGFERAQSGFVALAIDPSRGSLLGALIETPSPVERVQQGGYVGYVILILGALAGVLGLVRWASITTVGRRVAAQRKTETPNTNNPLGRILDIYRNNQSADPETLELKLDEVVLRETSSLERFIWLVKVVSVIAPLLGLLGTVTGMIQTFQAITLFGAGDPKMMAGGISEALVTTMLGLVTAIPLVLLHATLANSTRRITDVLDEQSAGLIALCAEGDDVGS
jgi:biopolymer transport protein ExbB